MKKIYSKISELIIILALLAFSFHILTIFIGYNLTLLGILFTFGMMFIIVYFIDSLEIVGKRIFKNRSNFLVYYIKIIGIAIIVYYIYYFLVENPLF